jgi:hypothetical protein
VIRTVLLSVSKFDCPGSGFCPMVLLLPFCPRCPSIHSSLPSAVRVDACTRSCFLAVVCPAFSSLDAREGEWHMLLCFFVQPCCRYGGVSRPGRALAEAMDFECWFGPDSSAQASAPPDLRPCGVLDALAVQHPCRPGARTLRAHNTAIDMLTACLLHPACCPGFRSPYAPPSC